MAARTKKPIKKNSHMDRLSIEPTAIRMIAARAALSIKGVFQLGNADGEKIEVSSLKELSSAVVLKERSGRLEIEVRVVVLFRENIPLLSVKVQQGIRTAVFSMTGLEVNLVVVRVVGIDISQSSVRRTVSRKH